MSSLAFSEKLASAARLLREPRTVEKPVRSRLVVAGFGMVGHKLLERLAALGALERYDVTVIGEEPQFAYDRIRLTDLLDHGDQGRLELVRRDWYEERGVRVIVDNPVVSVDRESRTVKTASQDRIVYDQLVLATGSAPLVPQIEGADQEGVLVYRTIADAGRVRDAAVWTQSALILGGGLLGLEAAHALKKLGLRVTVVEAAPYLMSRQLDAAGAQLLERKVRALGVETITDLRAVKIERLDEGFRLHFQDEDAVPLDAGMLVLAAGVRPRDELARHAGLPIASGTGGVIVDDLLRTADPAIFAIGECAWHDGVTYGLAAPGYRMAETLAMTLSGRDSRFHGFEPSTRLKLMGVDVAALGDHAQPGTEASWRAAEAYRQVTLKDGRIIGASAVGPWPEIATVHQLIQKRRRIWPWQLRRFKQTGMFLKSGAAAPVSEWPDAAVVCNCMSVTCGRLRTACSGQTPSVEALIRETGASTMCGSCRPLLAELIGNGDIAEEPKGQRTLLAVGAAVVALASIFLFGPSTALATSVQDVGIWDIIYRENAWRQATGFALLGCALLAAGLSLRKRIRAFRFGDFAWWRLAHGLLGLAALLTLVAHTGLRFGTGVNLWLMTSFLAANAVGALAAVGLQRPRSRWAFWLHVVSVWPLPVLIGFHVLAAYYF